MKAIRFIILAAFFCLPALSACKKADCTEAISDVRSDLFLAETQEFTLTLACISREQPFLSDGIVAPRSDYIEITLTPALLGERYTVTLLDDGWGGEMSYRSASGDYTFSGTHAYPAGSVSLRISWGDKRRDIVATSVKTDNTLSAEDAARRAFEAERDNLSHFTADGTFLGEIHVRLLRRDKNYYYVGFVARSGETYALLLDAETGEVLARRAPR